MEHIQGSMDRIKGMIALAVGNACSVKPMLIDELNYRYYMRRILVASYKAKRWAFAHELLELAGVRRKDGDRKQHVVLKMFANGLLDQSPRRHGIPGSVEKRRKYRFNRRSLQELSLLAGKPNYEPLVHASKLARDAEMVLRELTLAAYPSLSAEQFRFLVDQESDVDYFTHNVLKMLFDRGYVTRIHEEDGITGAQTVRYALAPRGKDWLKRN